MPDSYTARARLVCEFARALEERPGDFSLNQHGELVDSVTCQQWYIAADFWLFDPKVVRFGFWDRRRARRAVKAWKRREKHRLADEDEALVCAMARQLMNARKPISMQEILS